MAKAGMNVMNLEDLFVTTKQNEGAWYEPKINGKGIGIEFKILGEQSDMNVISGDLYTKAHEKVEKETDPVKKMHMERDAVVDRVSSVIVDLRVKDGFSVNFGGKPLEYSEEVIKKLLYENIELRTDLFSATFDSENFMTKKA